MRLKKLRKLIADIPRLAFPGSIHHVMVNAIQGQLLFRDNKDRRRYLRLVHGVLQECGARLHCLSILSTHAHIGIQVGATPLHVIMKRINESYARYFNKKYERQGYVFRGKYRSKPVLDDVYHRNLIVYVHRNAIEAGLVASVPELTFDEFTSHAALVGMGDAGAMDVDAVLRLFGPTAELALAAYLQQMEGAFEPETREMFERFPERWTPTGSTFIGPDDFVAKAEAEAKRRAAENARWEGWTLARLIDATATGLSVKVTDIRNGRCRRRDVSRAKAAIAAIATKRLGVSQYVLAEAFGVSQPAISRLVASTRGSEAALESRLLGGRPTVEAVG